MPFIGDRSPAAQGLGASLPLSVHLEASLSFENEGLGELYAVAIQSFSSLVTHLSGPDSASMIQSHQWVELLSESCKVHINKAVLHSSS